MNRMTLFIVVATLLIIPNTASAQMRRKMDGGLLRQGTIIQVRFPDNLDSDRNRNGDRFEAFLNRDLISNGRILALNGSVVYYTLVDVNAGGGARGDRSRVSLTLTGIQVESSVIPIETNTITISTAPSPNQRYNFSIQRSAAFNHPDIRPETAQRYEGDFLSQGAVVRVRFADNLGSIGNGYGDRFEAFLEQDLVLNGRVVAHPGSSVYFTMVDLYAGNGYRGNGTRVSLTLTGIQAGFSVIPIQTDTITIGTTPNRNQLLNFRIQRNSPIGRDNQPEADK